MLVAYHRIGGFLAHDDRLFVGRDGRVIITARDGASDVFFLSSADLTELVNVLEAANFPSLKALYKPPFVISDGFEYTLTYRNKTVVVLEGGTPAELEAHRPGRAARKSVRLSGFDDARRSAASQVGAPACPGGARSTSRTRWA